MEKHNQIEAAFQQEDKRLDTISESPDDIEQQEYLTGVKLACIVGGLIVALFLHMLDSTIVSTAIPRITTEFDSLNDVGWYGSSYLMVMCAFQLPYGRIFELFESKRSFLITMVIFLVGSTICATAVSSIMLICGRAIAGIGAAGFQSSMMSILNASAPLHKRPKLIGLTIGIASLGLLLGPVVGGLLTQSIGWRYCFWINLPLGVVIFVLFAFLRVPNAQSVAAKSQSITVRLENLDPIGCLIWAGAITMILLALTEGGVRYAWNSSTILGLLIGACLLLAYFFVWEHRQGEKAMLSTRILKHGKVASAVGANLCMSGAFYLVAYFLPIYFQSVKGASPGMSGVYSLASVATQMMFSILSGFAISKFGRFTPFMIAGNTLGITAMALLSTMNVGTTVAHFTGVQIILGAARGCTIQPPLNVIQLYLPNKDVPVASSLLMFSQNFGGSVWITAGQAVFAHTLRHRIHQFSASLDADEIIDIGPLNFRSILSGAEIMGVMRAYSSAVTTTFFLSAAGLGLTFLLTFGFGWTPLQKKQESEALRAEHTGEAAEAKC